MGCSMLLNGWYSGSKELMLRVAKPEWYLQAQDTYLDGLRTLSIQRQGVIRVFVSLHKRRFPASEQVSVNQNIYGYAVDNRDVPEKQIVLNK